LIPGLSTDRKSSLRRHLTSMKITLSQRVYVVRDAGEIAFGLLVFAVIFFPLAAIPGTFTVVLLFALLSVLGGGHAPPAAPVQLQHWMFWAAIALWWLAGMTLIVRRYQRIARTWDHERRGTDLFTLVEFVGFLAKLGAGFVLRSQIGEGLDLSCLSVFLDAFVLLLAASHLTTYAILRYRPHRKELALWLCIAAIFVADFV
jgi:hypothetical protein